MKLLFAPLGFALTGCFALVLCSGCTSSSSQQTAQVPPPSVSTTAPMPVSTAPVGNAAANTTVQLNTTGTPAPTVATAMPVGGGDGGAPAKRGGIDKEVASIAGRIRSASTEVDAVKHVFSSRRMAEMLGDEMKATPARAEFFAHWQTAMKHLQAAAQFKANSFKAWNELDAKSKVLSMESELTAAQKEADITQKMTGEGVR